MSVANEAASLIRKRLEREAQNGPLAIWRVAAVDAGTGKVALRSELAADDGEQFYARVAGFTVAPGDRVLVARVASGALVVIGQVLATLADELGLDAPLDAPLSTRFEPKAQTAADTTSTTDTANYQQAITSSIALGPGTWTIKARGQGNFSHSASGSMSRVLEIDGVEVGAGTVTLGTARETYVIAEKRTGVAGNRTVTCRLKYRSNSAGTTSCRAPALDLWAERE